MTPKATPSPSHRTAGSRNLFAALLLAATFQASAASAEVLDFGGFSDRFKGDGDKEPPGCQIDIPRGSRTPFYIKWNCSDNELDPQDIRTELWILKKDAAYPELLQKFLGFPAFFRVDEGTLGVQNFADGLPVSFRLIATDRAGVSTMSPFIPVTATANSLSSCDLSIVTEGTESEGETTGVPSQTVEITGASVSASQLSDTELRIATTEAAKTTTCEIESLCDDDELAFSASITLDSGQTSAGSAAGSLTIGSDLLVTLSGTSQSSGDVVTGLDLEGETEIDGTNATVSLSCSD